MRKLFKKSLACILTAIICVSLCVAAVPASAATPTYATNEIVAKAGETVTIDFAVSNFINVKGALIKFFLPDAVAEVKDVNLNGADLAAWNDDEGTGYYKVEGNSIKFLSLFGYAGEMTAPETLTFNVEVVIAEDAEVKEYTYPAPEFQITENGESLVDVTGAFAKFEVVNAHTHEYGVAYLNTEDGKWYKDCSCGDKIAAEANIDNNIRRSASFTVGAKFGVAIGIMKSAVDVYDSFELIVKSKHYRSNDTEKYALTEVIDKYIYVAEGEAPEGYNKQSSVDTANDLYVFEYSDLTAYEMTLDFDIYVYGYKNGKIVAVSKTWTHNLAERALREANNAAAAKKPAYVDIVNYGTEVQKYFGSENPGTDIAANTVYPNAAFTALAGYATADSLACAELAVNASKLIREPIAQGKLNGGVNVIVGASNQIMYTWGITGFDTADMKIVVNYVDSYKNDKSVTVPFSELDAADNYAYLYEEVALFDANKLIEAKVYSGDVLLGTRQYTIESFANKMANDAKLSKVADQLVKVRYSTYEALKSGFPA